MPVPFAHTWHAGTVLLNNLTPLPMIGVIHQEFEKAFQEMKPDLVAEVRNYWKARAGNASEVRQVMTAYGQGVLKDERSQLSLFMKNDCQL